MIKLLLDANLSYRLVSKLKNSYPDCMHVSKTGLSMPAQDNEIWDWAKINDYVIVTMDEDFESLSHLYGYPPKVILLKTGNQSTGYIAELFQNRLDAIIEFFNNRDLGILEIY